MPYIPPIVIDTPDLIGQQIQFEQQNQQRQFQLDQMRERQEQKIASQAQGYVNRSLSNYEKGQLGKITQPVYLQKAQDAFYTWQDAGTGYFENPNAQNRQALDNAANTYRQTIGSLLAYDQEEKDYMTKIYTNPNDFRTTPEEFSNIANQRRNAVANLQPGQPVPLGLSLEPYIIRNDDVKPFSFVDEGVALADDIQGLIDAEPNKYAPGGKLNIELIRPLLNERASYKLGEYGQVPYITIARANKELQNPSAREYGDKIKQNPEFGTRQEAAALEKLVGMVASQLTPPKGKEATEAEKERAFPKKYDLGEVPTTINGAEGVEQVFSGNRAIRVTLAGKEPKIIVGRGRAGGKDYVLTIPTSQLEMWEEGYTGATQSNWEPATSADLEAIKQNMGGYFNAGSFKSASKAAPKKGVSSQQGKEKINW